MCILEKENHSEQSNRKKVVFEPSLVFIAVLMLILLVNMSVLNTLSYKSCDRALLEALTFIQSSFEILA